MKQSDLDRIVKAQDNLKAFAEETQAQKFNRQLGERNRETERKRAELTPINWSMDREGNFIDPKANAMFDDWCNGEAQKQLSEFFDFINV